MGSHRQSLTGGQLAILLKNMLVVQGFCVLILSGLSSTGEETELPSLPEAVRLLQLDTVIHLRQTNKEQENIISAKDSQIAKLEVRNAGKDETIGNLTATTSQLKEDARDKVLEKEQCDNMSQTKDEAIVEHLAKIAELEMEKRDQLLLLANKTEEIAQLKGDFKAKMKEKKKQCEAEETHLSDTFALKSMEEEANCKKEIAESESQHALKFEETSAELKQHESFISFMSDVMLHDNLMRLKVQKLTESQALQIKEANENLKRQMDAYLTCESAANTTAAQAETISMLRTSLANALVFPHLNTSSLEKRENIASFMLELMESYNEQTRRIDNLKAILEKEEDVEDRAIELAEKLTNLTSALRSAASVNLDILEEQAEVIQSQGESLTQLTPLLRYTHEDVVWRQKAERTGVESVSTCGCLPRSKDFSRPLPAKVEYHCGETSNRSFSLQCPDGVCKSYGLPSCTEPVEWEETNVTQQCQETLFKDTVVFCGKNGTKDVTNRKYTSEGLIEERVVTPCLDCTDLFTWTAWRPCNSSNNTSEGAKCRHRGNDDLGFEEERKVDCVMGGWSDWSGCSQTCSDGIARRSREVVEQPCNGGLACSDQNEIKNCNIEPCAGAGGSSRHEGSGQLSGIWCDDEDLCEIGSGNGDGGVGGAGTHSVVMPNLSNSCVLTEDTLEYNCHTKDVNFQARENAEVFPGTKSWRCCRQLCLDSDKCSFWVWAHESAGQYAEDCVLMPGYGAKAEDTNVISGPKMCSQ